MRIIVWVDHITDGPVGVAYGPEEDRDRLQRRAWSRAYMHMHGLQESETPVAPSDYSQGEVRDNKPKGIRDCNTIVGW